ncbi:hypothetical protein [Lacisediminihabitans changchengi]|uniref:Uncharacterized protein n=1 Tax=Lacisediminihabitans changchengi TaxID=2787634 RepID=A0A934SQ23_9MICO|nr:hypothetical protein [Lacisediminihabitans changchengi]MBK4346943.1 hypothetical protein [Lacisediminihabitans changchengi]MBK4347934.1 hypothetical protein [Lacisediminihabitans changchengi]
MAHPYPLHVAVDVECYCCRLIQPFTFSSPNDQLVCAQCSRHYGDGKAEKRDLDHLAMWSARYSELAQRYRDLAETTDAERMSAAATETELRARVAELTTAIANDFAATDLGGSRALVENEVVTRAERRAELANRLNDRIMAVLWQLDRLHHSTDKATCSCGKRLVDCGESMAIEPQRQAIRDWERRNLALRASGKRDALPDDFGG